MNPYYYVKQATENGESLLSLCCGVGFELIRINASKVTAVDIAPQYLAQVKDHCPIAETVCASTPDYVETVPDDSYDVVSIIDGIEHMSKEDGLKVIDRIKKIATKEVLLFTPEGYLRNEPHNAWDIEGADEYQTHKSGWEVKELEDLGFDLVAREEGISQHGEPYHALMFVYRR